MNNKNVLKGSIIASAILATAGFTANANSLFSYNNLGSGENVRTTLSSSSADAKTMELKCGTDSTKGKDAKCGKKSKDGKCGAKKGKDGKCGEGKCGGGKS